MQFKVPPGSLSWLTALWILLGAFVSYSSFKDGDPIYAWGGLIFCIAGILVWFDVREVAWPLMIWFGIVIASALLLLVIKGFTIRPVWGIVMAGYMIYDLNNWRNSE